MEYVKEKGEKKGSKGKGKREVRKEEKGRGWNRWKINESIPSENEQKGYKPGYVA